MDWKLQLIVLPVSDIEASKAFYVEQMGFGLDVDHVNGDFRVVQLTPPGSACSVTIGSMSVSDSPSPIHGLHLVVDDIEAARAELLGRGIDAPEPHHYSEAGVPEPGIHPERIDYGTFLDLADPDGNTWLVQEVGHTRP